MELKKLSSEEFKFCISRMPRSCVDIVFVYRDKLLLLCRKIEPDNGNWALPGGSVLKGETTEQAAIRKAKEETGIIIDEKSLKLVCVVTAFLSMRQDICITYKVLLNEQPSIILDYQHSKHCWFKKLPKNINPIIKRQVNGMV